MSLRILPVLMWLPVPAAAGTGMGLLSFLRLPVRPAARRRLCPLLFSLLTCWALATASSAQPPPNVAPGPQRPQPDSRDEEDNVQQRELLQLLLETDAALRAQKWVEAAARFDAGWQRVHTGEDPLLTPQGGDVQQILPGQSQVLAGGRSRLADLFQSAPPAFREEYRRQFADTAEPQLLAAVQRGDAAALRTIAARWRFLPQGETAVRLLARVSVERGDFLEATLQLERLRQMSAQPSAALQLQLALTAWNAGLDADALSGLRSLIAAQPGGRLTVGGTDLQLPDSAADLPGWLAQVTGRSPAARDALWTQPLGDFRRSRPQPAGPVTLQPHWSSSLFVVHDVLFQEQLNPLLSRAQELLQLTAARYLSQNATVLPVPSPLLLNNLLIFRTIAGVRAVDATTGELQWETTHPDGRLRALSELRPEETAGPGDLPEVPLPGNRRVPHADAWQRQALAMNAEVLSMELFYQLVQTNTAGQLSASDRTVFVCEDSAWVTWSGDPDARGSVSNRLPANYLRAYDAQTGVFRWEAGGQRTGTVRANPLGGFYFLGAPLVLGSRIYVLAESGEGIFLLQIGEPQFQTSAPESANPRVLHSQLLAVPQYGLQQHPVRKHAGLIPSYGQGLIICPTCDEHILAISAEDHSVRWAYRYAGTVRLPDLGAPEPVLAGALNSLHSRSVDLNSRWADSLPRIVDSRIIVTPRDADQLFCLDLQTGQELFRIPRGVSRTVAAVTSRYLVLAGNKSLTAFSMQNGELLWTSEIRDGQICGQATFDEHVLHIPTTAPSIDSFEIASGRRLLTRQLPTADMPGNLLNVGGLLLSQNLTSVTCLGQSSVAPPDRTLQAAQELLLAGNTADAVEQLQAVLQSADASAPVRELLIDALLESLRVDFAGNSQHIPRLRSLIAATSIDDRRIADTLATLLGMTPADAAILPAQLEALDQSGQQLDYLFELIVRGLQDSHDAPVPRLVTSIAELLPELLPSQQRTVTAGFLSRSNSRLLVAAVRQVLAAQTAERAQQIQSELVTRLTALLQPTAATPAAPPAQEATASGTTATGTAVATAHVIRDLTTAGMETAAQQLLASLPDTAAVPGQRLLHEQIVLQMLRSGNPAAPAQLTALWDSWLAAGNLSAVQTMRADLLSTDGDQPRAVLKYHVPGMAGAAVRQTLQAWDTAHPAVTAASTLWRGTPQITQSDDSSLWPAGQQKLLGPQSVLPLFGFPGLFRGWAFVQEADSPDVLAYDADGVRRWSFRPAEPIAVPMQSGLISDRYVLACGHLLAIKMNQMLFVLDTSAASADTPPQLLWSCNLTALHRDEDTRMLRQFIPGWERVLHYAPQPAGLYPCGPLTATALPVISGRRLFVFDSLTGVPAWQLDGIPQDAVLLGTDAELLILSESERQIEVRDLIDGGLRSVAPVPEWWIDANENIGASVRDVELEPGMELLWRIAVTGRTCLLFRLGHDACALESRDITTNEVLWQVALPQDSVFSNVAEDLVAVLSNGRQLQLFRIDSGSRLADVPVTAVNNPRELYLRPSLDRLLILPEAVDDPSLELDPVGNGLHVFGRMYALDRTTLQLAWDEPLDHRFIRPVVTSPGPVLANAPVLVLLARGPRPGNRPDGPRATVYSVRIVDVRSGKDLHNSSDVGNTLSYLGLVPDAARQQLQISFDRHILTLDYNLPDRNAAP